MNWLINKLINLSHLLMAIVKRPVRTSDLNTEDIPSEKMHGQKPPKNLEKLGQASENSHRHYETHYQAHLPQHNSEAHHGENPRRGQNHDNH